MKTITLLQIYNMGVSDQNNQIDLLMQRSKLLPSIVSRYVSNENETPIRRRNLSLSTTNQNTHRNNIDRDQNTNIKCTNLAKCYSKKNKLFLGSEKMKKARDLTKLCQDNISEYMFLKNEVKKTQVDERGPQKLIDSIEVSPKLSVKLINMPVNMSYKPKNDQLTDCTQIKMRIKTQPSPKKCLRIKNLRQLESKVAIYRPLDLSPKKYKQLTLREIVESEDQFSDKLQLYQKIKEFKQKIRDKISLQLENEYQPLDGW